MSLRKKCSTKEVLNPVQVSRCLQGMFPREKERKAEMYEDVRCHASAELNLTRDRDVFIFLQSLIKHILSLIELRMNLEYFT